MSSTVGSIDHTSTISASEREQFDRDGFIVIRGALTPDEVNHYAGALDRVYARAVAAGQVTDGASMHQLSAVANCSAAQAVTSSRFPGSNPPSF